MVYSEIIRQAQLFCLAVLTGTGLLFLYDLLRIFRRIVKHKTAGIAIEDMVFWLFCAFWLFGFMYRQNEGMIRGFIILGACIGMLLYNVLLSRWIVKGGTAALTWMFRMIYRILSLIGAPFRFLGRLCGKRFRVTGRFCKKNMRRVKKRLKKIGKAVKMGIYKL